MTKQRKLSRQQIEIFNYIKREILEKGYPPTVREIGKVVGLKSSSSVHSHIDTLEKSGYIKRDPAKPRSIEITEDCFSLARRDVVNVPILINISSTQSLYEVQ
jgi:repressor LexA